MATHRQYTEGDKATALAMLEANGGNVLRTARELGIPQSTLRKWREGLGVSRDVAEKCDEKKEELDGLFERVVRTYLGRALQDGVVAGTGGKDAVITAATAADKMQLLRGKPTSINRNENVDELSDDELADIIRAGRNGAAAKANGQA